MEQSEHQFQFCLSGHSFLLQHEGLPLQLLSLVNRGTPRPHDDQIRLKAVPASPTLTLGDLAADKARFNLPVCIESNRLVLHFGKSYNPNSSTVN